MNVGRMVMVLSGVTLVLLIVAVALFSQDAIEDRNVIMIRLGSIQLQPAQELGLDATIEAEVVQVQEGPGYIVRMDVFDTAILNKGIIPSVRIRADVGDCLAFDTMSSKCVQSFTLKGTPRSVIVGGGQQVV